MRGIFRNAFLLLFPLLGLSGCSGCEDGIKLIRACSWQTEGQFACKGSGVSYELADPAEVNIGICQAGVLRCRRDIETIEEHCPYDTEDCKRIWYQDAQYDSVCVGHIKPKLESCFTDLDDDCDGQVNEGFDADNDGFQSAALSQARDDGFQACGTDCDDTNAEINPTATEVCDGIDNDCDGEVDDGLETLGDCTPFVPENINIDDLVVNNSISGCRYQMGKLKCVAGEIVCQGAEFVGPTSEICDGFDNDCDGEIDHTRGEIQLPDEGQDCGSNVGICEFGQTRCFAQDLQCVGGTDPINILPDSCDGIDTDCDGLTDEDAEPKLCTNGCPITGIQRCEGGGWTPCNAPGPGNEDEDACNGMDDDCDGLVDEGQECQCDPAEIGPNAPDCLPDEMIQAGLSCGVGKKDCICRDGNCRYGACYLACDGWAGDNQPNDDLGTWWGVCPPEQCDRWDWNCWSDHRDSLVDVPCQCDPNSPVPEIQAASIASDGNCEQGECTAGTQSCEFNNQTQTWEMLPLDCNAVGPEEEVCDELDNDCDGESDEDLHQFDKVDMVFAIDITGSMDEEIQNVHDAISVYAADFAQTEHRFSLVLFPAPYGGGAWRDLGSPATQCGSERGIPAHPPYSRNRLPYWRMTGLVGVQAFLAALNNILNVGLVCGAEPSYDVLEDLATPADIAGIGWRDDAYPYIFLIGDEDGQSWRNTTEASLAPRTVTCDEIGGCPCTPPNCAPEYNVFEIHCFVSQAHFTDYDQVCRSVIDINTISAPVLRDIFADVCL